MRIKISWYPKCGTAIIRYFLFLLFTLCVVSSLFQIWYILVDINGKKNIQGTCALPHQKVSLRFIHQITQTMWKNRDFLVVFGFPSLDIPIRRWRRRMQRVTCWQFPEVAARHNNFTGAFLPLYLLARHPINNYSLSSELMQETEQWQDVIIHPMNEGRPSTDKIVSDNGYWGFEAEIGSSKKTFFWFCFALCQFPRAPYVGKGDDDTFISVPQYLADLRLLPRKRIYWGRYRHVGIAIGSKGKTGKVKHMFGFCLTLSRDAAESFALYKPFQAFMSLPYSKTIEPKCIAMNMQYEDVMLGRLLQEIKFPVIYVKDSSSRFWFDSSLPPNEKFVAVHKLKEKEYYAFTSRIMTYKRLPNSTQIIKERPDFYSILNSK